MLEIGNLIKQVLKEKHITISEFARKINKERANVYNIFKRSSIDTVLLSKISEVLEYDFFQHYTVNESVNKGNEPSISSGQNVELNKLQFQIDRLEKEVKTLNERLIDKEKIIDLLEKKNL